MTSCPDCLQNGNKPRVTLIKHPDTGSQQLVIISLHNCYLLQDCSCEISSPAPLQKLKSTLSSSGPAKWCNWQSTVSPNYFQFAETWFGCESFAYAMAGRVSGVAARIQQQCPLALYVHCFSHKLNHVIVHACQVQAVRNAMGVISKIAFFFENSPKKQAALEEKIRETEQPNRKKHLLDLRRTRWVYHHEALKNFSQLYETCR